jgi:hypothetical protein
MPTLRKLTEQEARPAIAPVKPSSQRGRGRSEEDVYRGQQRSNPTAGRVLPKEGGIIRFAILMDCGGGHTEELWGRSVNQLNTFACEQAAEDGFVYAYHAGYHVEYENSYLYWLKEKPITTNQNVKAL